MSSHNICARRTLLITTELKLEIYASILITWRAQELIKYAAIPANFRHKPECFSLLQVSWVRHRDIHLLTVGRYTYTSDQRFEAMHSPHTEEWTLRIRYAQRKDSGNCLQICSLTWSLSFSLRFFFTFRHLRMSDLDDSTRWALRVFDCSR